MRVEYLVVSPFEPDQITPASLGLGGPLDLWQGGWNYPQAGVWIQPRPAGNRLPEWARSEISIAIGFDPVSYFDDGDTTSLTNDVIEVFAAAWGGCAVVLPLEDDVELEPQDPNPAARALARGYLIADAFLGSEPVAPASPYTSSRRGPYCGGQPTPRTDAWLARFIDAAIAGDSGAIAILRAWIRRTPCEEEFSDRLGAGLSRVARAPDELLAVYVTTQQPLVAVDSYSGDETDLSDRFSPEWVVELERSYRDPNTRVTLLQRLAPITWRRL